MSKIRILLKKFLLNFSSGRRIWQIYKAISLLRNKCFRQLFFEVRENDICLDLGANIGYASLVMWLKGVKKIYSLEPNFQAFEELSSNLQGIKNISIHNMAIANQTRKERLFLHKSIKEIEDSKEILKFSQASSLLSDKTNIGEYYQEVQGINFSDLFSEFMPYPTIIKCDIEGGEYIIYEQLIKYAKSKIIRKVFVECHAIKYPQYLNQHKSFLKLIKENDLEKKINTNWH